MSVGHRSTQTPQPVQSASAASCMPGGRIETAALRLLPFRKSRRDSASCRMATPSMARRAGWPEDYLEAPYKEAIPPNDTNGQDGPDAEGQDEECQQFAAPTGFRRGRRGTTCQDVGQGCLPPATIHCRDTSIHRQERKNNKLYFFYHNYICIVSNLDISTGIHRGTKHF